MHVTAKRDICWRAQWRGPFHGRSGMDTFTGLWDTRFLWLWTWTFIQRFHMNAVCKSILYHISLKDKDYLCVTGLAILFEMTWSDVHIFVTLGTLPLSHSLTDAALSQGCKHEDSKRQNYKRHNCKQIKTWKVVLTVIQQVCDVQAESGQDGVKHFEVFSKSRHEQQQAGRSLVGSIKDCVALFF